MSSERPVARDVLLLLAGAVLTLAGGAASQVWAAHLQDVHDSAVTRRAQQAEAEAAMWEIVDAINPVLGSAERAVESTETATPLDTVRSRLAQFEEVYANWQAKRPKVAILLAVYFPGGLLNIARIDSLLMNTRSNTRRIVQYRIDDAAGRSASLRAARESEPFAELASIRATRDLVAHEEGYFAFMIQHRVAGSLDPDATLPPAQAGSHEAMVRKVFRSVNDSIAAAGSKPNPAH